MIRRTLILTALILLLPACGERGPGELVALPQSITGANGLLVVNYPEGWLAQDGQTQLFFANSPEALAAAVTALADGQVRGAITLFTLRDLAIFQFDGRPGPNDVLDAIVNQGNQQSSTRVSLNGRRRFSTGGRDVAVATGSADFDLVEGGVIIAVTRINDVYIFFNFNTFEGQAGRFEPIVRSMAATVRYAPPSS